ncbi:sensor histidine kinase [Tannockella kyphosi]|uniref:sensor histidine kinase n=1 Tax=Tannockella kyphosi TaxID=2899121 RepID=UPI00201181C0|nr:HAMP domain-containing sensor histidine kinase [Tannockella kyphosi]
MKKVDLTMKKRLYISNILAIAIPVFISIIIIIIGITVTFFYVRFGTGVNFIDSETFYKASQNIFEVVDEQLQNKEDIYIDSLSNTALVTLDNNEFYILISSNDTITYSYGSSLEVDESLISAITSLGGVGFVSNNSRELYMAKSFVNDQVYTVAIFATCSDLSYNTLKIGVSIISVSILLALLISIKVTNNFLIKFVYNRIQDPLELLYKGTSEITAGNLSYRIEYPYQDEFKPVFDNFNEMAIRLKTSLDRSEYHEKSKQEILVGISHDLRSPLTSIRAYVEGLLDGIAKSPESQQKYLQIIKNKSEDIDQMITKIMSISKLELGELPINPIYIQLDGFIKEYMQKYYMEYLEKGLTIQLGHIASTSIYGDNDQLLSIFSNILENSVKYNKNRNPILTISLEKEGKYSYLSFKDNGDGVQSKDLEHLFEVFYRSDPSRHNPKSGNGLGLAIVKGEVERMNGHVIANNMLGGGLEILICIPHKEISDE